jgi:hypothetical protein
MLQNPYVQKAFVFIKANKALSITWGVLLIIGIGFGGHALLAKNHFHFVLPKYTAKIQPTPTIDPNQQIQQKNAEMIASIGKEIALPTNEQPILATVSDKTQLQNQDFFKQAQDGDKILLYPKNKKAFLYRPAINHVIAQAPLIYQDSSQEASVAAAATASAPQSTGPVPTIRPQGKVLYNNQ